MPPTITPQAFVAKWRGDTRKERSVAQEHFIDLCRLLGRRQQRRWQAGLGRRLEARVFWLGVQRPARRPRQSLSACLTFYQFAPPQHRLVRSTNLLERFFREFRTKADEIGAFPNDISCLVVFHLIAIRDDTKHDRGKTAKIA